MKGDSGVNNPSRRHHAPTCWRSRKARQGKRILKFWGMDRYQHYHDWCRENHVRPFAAKQFTQSVISFHANGQDLETVARRIHTMSKLTFGASTSDYAD